MYSNGAKNIWLIRYNRGIAMSFMGNEMLTHHSALGTTYAVGKWNFASATVDGQGQVQL